MPGIGRHEEKPQSPPPPQHGTLTKLHVLTVGRILVRLSSLWLHSDAVGRICYLVFSLRLSLKLSFSLGVFLQSFHGKARLDSLLFGLLPFGKIVSLRGTCLLGPCGLLFGQTGQLLSLICFMVEPSSGGLGFTCGSHSPLSRFCYSVH